AANADTAETSGFLSEAYLPHFDPDSKFRRQNFDQFSEVDAIISGVVECRFSVVSLVFDIRQLHFQLHTPDNLACTVQRWQLALLDLFILVEITLLGDTVYLTDIAIVGHLLLLHL